MLRWPPAVLDDDGARDALATVVAWVLREGRPELPPEHTALATQPFGVWLSLAHLEGSPWRELLLSQHTAMGLATWATWVDRDGAPGAAFLSPGAAWALSPFLLELMRRLPGDTIELRYALAGRLPLLPRGTWVHPNGWWDEWKSRSMGDEEGPTLGEIYRRWLYPRVLRCLDGMEGTRVVDVCGGDGELAATVLAARPGADVLLVERNRASCEAARARLGGGVIEGDAAQGWPGEHDVVLLVGAVQGNVMSADAGLAVMRHAFASLRPGGYAVITGWSPCLLDAADLRRLGFEVLNMAVPPTEEDPNPRQLYVARRPVG